jgi:L-ribulose-5-phosphate 4-epimerase
MARMAYFTIGTCHDVNSLGRALHDKHYLRKHGKDAYYGQAKEAT